MNESPNNLEFERLQVFSTLRRQAHEQADHDLIERMKTNPRPTHVEIEIGGFKEKFEPQVRDAVINLYAKGYKTYMSGFHGRQPWKQFIALSEGHELSPPIQKELADMGVAVEARAVNTEDEQRIMAIEFVAPVPDLSEINSLWEKIYHIIPDKGDIAPRNNSLAAIKFRYQFAPHIPADFESLEKRVAAARSESRKKYLESVISAMKNNQPLPSEPSP